jgi:hypothetical protein
VGVIFFSLLIHRSTAENVDHDTVSLIGRLCKALHGEDENLLNLILSRMSPKSRVILYQNYFDSHKDKWEEFKSLFSGSLHPGEIESILKEEREETFDRCPCPSCCNMRKGHQ